MPSALRIVSGLCPGGALARASEVITGPRVRRQVFGSWVEEEETRPAAGGDAAAGDSGRRRHMAVKSLKRPATAAAAAAINASADPLLNAYRQIKLSCARAVWSARAMRVLYWEITVVTRRY